MNRERWISVGITYALIFNIYGQHAYRRKLEQSAQRVSAQKKLREVNHPLSGCKKTGPKRRVATTRC